MGLRSTGLKASEHGGSDARAAGCQSRSGVPYRHPPNLPGSTSFVLRFRSPAHLHFGQVSANFRVANSAEARGSRYEARRYDLGMTKSKIAISLPRDQLARVHREVRAGRAGSVSGYIATVLAEQERRESLRELLQDLIEQHGEPSAKDIKWAERALEQRRG